MSRVDTLERHPSPYSSTNYERHAGELRNYILCGAAVIDALHVDYRWMYQSLISPVHKGADMFYIAWPLRTIPRSPTS